MIVLFADTPLIEVATLRKLTAALEAGAGIAVLGFEPADATGYGRLIVDGEGRVTAIREHEDASEAERRIRLCNAGAMAFRVADLAGLLARIGNANAKGEYYLTDAIALAADGRARSPGPSRAPRTRRWASTRASSWPPPRRCSSAARARGPCRGAPR